MKYPPAIGPAAAQPGRPGPGGVRRHPARVRPLHLGIASALAAAIVVGASAVVYLNHRPPGQVETGGTVRSPVAHASATPSFVPFNCAASSSLGRGPAPALAYVDNVGFAESAGYDRVTIEFTDGAPAVSDLVLQDSAVFGLGPGGPSVTLLGNAGAVLTLHGADGHTRFRGESDQRTSGAVVLEARRIVDAGHEVKWAIGLARKGCYRMLLFDQPARLVVDFQVG